MACLTGLAHATHLKGGSVTWKRDAEATDFVVKAEVIINFDLSADENGGFIDPLDPNADDIPRVNGHPFYQPGNTVTANINLNWGDGTSGETLTRFEVVAVDPAAQIVTVRAIEYDANGDGIEDAGDVVLDHTYDWPDGVDHYDITASSSARDDGEELANRASTMMIIRSRVTEEAGNTPPSFDPEQSSLVIVDKGTVANPVVTFQVPVATDADAGDTVKYSFIAKESDASSMGTPGDTPWETVEGMSITDAGVISWNTSQIYQTIKTYCIQVVAKDYAAGSSVPKSSTTLEFQVWVDDTTQTGVPEIALSPSTPVIYVHPDQETPAEFRVVGFDHGENSRLKLIYDEEELPAGAVIRPTAGFAGEGHGNEGDYLTCFFSWKPTAADLNSEYTMHFKFEDEDGFQSDEVTATVRVVDAPVTPVEPLVLTVTPTSYIRVAQGALVSFTVTGTCATAGVPLALYTYSDIRDGAAFTPALPASGTSSVTSTFTWQTDSGDLSDPDEPIQITIRLGDAYRREVIETVTIVVQPPPPVVTLAAGTTVPIPATAWEALVVDFNATGGNSEHPALTFLAENAGTVEQPAMDSPAANRVIWRVVPGQIRNGILRIRVSDEWGGSSVLEIPIALANPGAPAWWESTDPAEQVLTGGAPVDFGMANQGQFKMIASRAYAEMAEEFPNIATATPEGAALTAYISSFLTGDGNYEPLLQGELKHAASLFYKAIGAVTGKGDIGVPWEKDSGNDHNYSPATVGQVKMIFSFPQPLRGVIFNEPPSSVAITSPATGTHFIGAQDINLQASASDPDGNLDRVEFYENGVLFATDSSAPYAATWPEGSLGSYVFTAKAIDTKGLELTSSAVTVEVDSSAPSSVVITSPAPGAYFTAGQPVTIQVSASDPDNNIVAAILYEGETPIQSPYFPDYSSFQMTWNQSTPGIYQLRVKVIDTDGQELMSAPLDLGRSVNQPPVVNSFLPVQNERFAATPTASLVVSASVSDSNGLGSVEFSGGPNESSLTPLAITGVYGALYEADWNNLSAGSYVVKVKATDAYGAVTEILRNFTVVTPTTVSIQEGVNGYTGMVDTYLNSNAATTNYGSSLTLSTREANPTIVMLMKWDLAGKLPAGARVLDASLTLNVTIPSNDVFWVWPLAREWTEDGATWNATGTGVNWTTAGAASTSGSTKDYEPTRLAWLASKSPTGANTFVSEWAFKYQVQSWIDSPATNFGVRLASVNDGLNKEAKVSSSEATTSSQRPALTIVYY